MISLPILIIDSICFILVKLYESKMYRLYYDDYQMFWSEVGDCIYETSWDFMEGRHYRIILVDCLCCELLEKLDKIKKRLMDMGE